MEKSKCPDCQAVQEAEQSPNELCDLCAWTQEDIDKMTYDDIEAYFGGDYELSR